MDGDHGPQADPQTAGEAAVIARSAAPITVDVIAAALVAAGVTPSSTIIVHSAMSRLGWIAGGGHAVVNALLGVVGEHGTIVMPAQTALSDPAAWENPPVPTEWIDVIRQATPAFDPRLTPLRGMGQVVECFARLPGAVHCGHPTVGFVAFGAAAASIAAPHPLSDSFGDSSPLGRLYELDAIVVLIGVDYSNNTSSHLAEHRSDFPAKQTVRLGSRLFVDGIAQWVEYDDVDHDADDFDQLAASFVAAGGQEARVPLGYGEVRVCRMRDIVDFGVTWMRTSPTRALRP